MLGVRLQHFTARKRGRRCSVEKALAREGVTSRPFSSSSLSQSSSFSFSCTCTRFLVLVRPLIAGIYWAIPGHFLIMSRSRCRCRRRIKIRTRNEMPRYDWN